jgi:hypothetical protein
MIHPFLTDAQRARFAYCLFQAENITAQAERDTPEIAGPLREALTGWQTAADRLETGEGGLVAYIEAMDHWYTLGAEIVAGQEQRADPRAQVVSYVDSAHLLEDVRRLLTAMDE